MKSIFMAFIVLYIVLMVIFVWQVREFVKVNEEYKRVKAEKREAQRKYDATVQELIDVLNERYP